MILDLAYIVAGLVFFAISVAFVHACERLRRP